MNLHRGLASLFVVLALTGCAQVATIQGQPPNPPYSPANNGEYLRDRGGDGGGDGGAGMQRAAAGNWPRRIAAARSQAYLQTLLPPMNGRQR